jgi:extradiol dioxygenase family protein
MNKATVLKQPSTNRPSVKKTATVQTRRKKTSGKLEKGDWQAIAINLQESPLQTTALAQPMSPSKMRVYGLNHFNITAPSALIEQVKRFYVDIIGLTVGPRAHLDHEGYWLYADGLPIVHLSASRQVEDSQPLARCGAYFNHISLNCVGLVETVERMRATGTPYRVVEILETCQTQVFLRDPAGVGVELTFLNEFL